MADTVGVAVRNVQVLRRGKAAQTHAHENIPGSVRTQTLTDVLAGTRLKSDEDAAASIAAAAADERPVKQLWPDAG